MTPLSFSAPPTIRQRSVNASKLERWLGADECERVSSAMKDWYGPPIALGNTPGEVYAHKGGDFRGVLRSGFEASAIDFALDKFKRIKRAFKIAPKRSQLVMGAGFTSLSDMIAEETAGKGREFAFQKVGTTGVVGATNTLWFVGNQPSAGAAAAAAPGGTVPTDATAGAFPFDNPTGGDTTHIKSSWPLASLVNTLLLYDRIFSVTKTMNSTATEAVTGVPTRYQSVTPGAADSAEGNFLFIECRTVLPATAHNWTTCTYEDQLNAASTLPSVTGNSANIVNRLDMPAQSWFCPLEAGDTGIQNLTQTQCSALVATGAIDFTIGHPIAWMPCPIVNIVCPIDYRSIFKLTRIFDDAALAFLEVTKPATGATTYTGTFATLAG